MSRHSSRRTNTTYIHDQISTPLPTIETTELYDDVESAYTYMKYPHSPQHTHAVNVSNASDTLIRRTNYVTNISNASDTLTRNTDLECEYVQLERHPLQQDDSSYNADMIQRKVDLSLPAQLPTEDDVDSTDGLIDTGQNVAYNKRSYRKYSLSLHETIPCLPTGGSESGGLTLSNPGITTLTPNDPHFTQSDPCLTTPEVTLTDQERSAYHHDERLTPSVLTGPQLTPLLLTEPGVSMPQSEECTLSIPEITPNPTYSEIINPSNLSYSPLGGEIPLTPPRPGSPDPIYANIHVVRSEAAADTLSINSRVKTLVYQFENELVSQAEPSDSETDNE